VVVRYGAHASMDAGGCSPALACDTAAAPSASTRSPLPVFCSWGSSASRRQEEPDGAGKRACSRLLGIGIARRLGRSSKSRRLSGYFLELDLIREHFAREKLEIARRSSLGTTGAVQRPEKECRVACAVEVLPKCPLDDGAGRDVCIGAIRGKPSSISASRDHSPRLRKRCTRGRSPRACRRRRKSTAFRALRAGGGQQLTRWGGH
jgi:hypothetical protein